MPSGQNNWTQNEYKDRGAGEWSQSLPSPAMMKLLLLCLGLTLVCAHAEVVTKNFDVPKVESVNDSDFGFSGGGFEASRARQFHWKAGLLLV